MIKIDIQVVCFNCGMELEAECDPLHYKTRLQVRPCANGCYENVAPEEDCDTEDEDMLD